MLAVQGIFHRYDATPFSENLSPVDPPNQINQSIVIRMLDQYIVLLLLIENQVIPENAKIIHKQIECVAMMPPMWAHLLQGQIQHHLDSMTVVRF